MNLARRQAIPLLAFIVVLVIIDTSILSVSKYFFQENDYFNLIIFSVLLVASIFGQYALLKIIGEKIQKFPSLIRHYLFHKLNTFVPFSLLFVIFLILLEMEITSSYHTILVSIIIWIIYSIALLNMSVLIFQFFQWIKFNKNYVVISYTITIIAILTNLTISVISVTYSIDIGPNVIPWFYNPVQSFSYVPNFMDLIYEITSITTFITMWLSSILLLSHYAKKYGLIKFGIIIIAPLVYFLSLFSPFLDMLFDPISSDYPYLVNLTYSILISSAKPIGGFLFGLIFWSASKTIDNKLLKEYMMIAGFGIMILFTSNQVIYLMRPDYPPFGLFTVSFFVIGSYISFLGIYASAICVAQDRELRQILRKSSERNVNLFNQIGKSQMEKKLITTADTTMRKFRDESGVQSVEDKDYKKYVEDAIREIQKEKRTNK
jgi:hypothetical protein